MSDFEKLVTDTAARYMQGRVYVERSELVPRVMEALVLELLERDDRFYNKHRGLHWGLASQRDRDERDRIAREEREAASIGEDLQPVHLLEPYGAPFGDAA